MSRTMQIIDELRDERANGDGWFVYLKPGWAIADHGILGAAQHCFGEDRKQDIWATMKRAAPCNCSECLKLLSDEEAQ
jgi:hypothetical protein